MDNEFIDTYPDKLMNSLSNPVGCGIEVKHNPNLQGTLGALLPSCITGFDIEGNPKLTGTLPEVPPLSPGLAGGVRVSNNGLTGEIPFSFLNQFTKQYQNIKYVILSGNKFTSLPDKYGQLDPSLFYMINFEDNCLTGYIFGSKFSKFNNNMMLLYSYIVPSGKTLSQLDAENANNDSYNMKPNKAKCSNSRDTFDVDVMFNSLKADNGQHCDNNHRVWCDENFKIIGLDLYKDKNLPNDLFTSLPHLKRVQLTETNIPQLPSGLEYLSFQKIVEGVSDIDFTQFTTLKELTVRDCKGINWSNILSSNNFVNMEKLNLGYIDFDFLKENQDIYSPLPNIMNMGTYPKLTILYLYFQDIFNDEAIEASGMQVSDVENLYHDPDRTTFERNFNTFPLNKFPSLQIYFVGGYQFKTRAKVTYNGNDFQVTIPPNNQEQYIVFPTDSTAKVSDIVSNISVENPDTNPLLKCSFRSRNFHLGLHCPLSSVFNDEVIDMGYWPSYSYSPICIQSEDYHYWGELACPANTACLFSRNLRAAIPDEMVLGGDANSICTETFPDIIDRYDRKPYLNLTNIYMLKIVALIHMELLLFLVH